MVAYRSRHGRNADLGDQMYVGVSESIDSGTARLICRWAVDIDKRKGMNGLSDSTESLRSKECSVG